MKKSREKGRGQPPLAGARVFRICYGRRSGRLAGQELLRLVLPTSHELVDLEEQHGADGRLIEAGGVEDVWNGRLRTPGISRRQVNLRDAPISQGHVDLYKEEETGERSALTEAGLGLFGPGDLAPKDALLLGQLPPPGGDRAESLTDSDLSGGARIIRDKGRIAVLAVAIALPDSVPAFARLRNVEDFHKRLDGYSSTAGRGCKQVFVKIADAIASGVAQAGAVDSEDKRHLPALREFRGARIVSCAAFLNLLQPAD